MISTFTAFIDANVFYGARLRSLLIYVAGTKLFRARWSQRVHDEWTAAVLRDHPDVGRATLTHWCNLMNDSVDDCLVEGFEPLIPCVTLPDPNDRHVLAAAIMTRANVIVTFNQKDFPSNQVEKFRIHTKHPDDFLIDAFGINPSQFIQAVRLDFNHYNRPPLEYGRYLDSLQKAGVPKLAAQLKPFGILMADE